MVIGPIKNFDCKINKLKFYVFYFPMGVVHAFLKRFQILIN